MPCAHEDRGRSRGRSGGRSRIGANAGSGEVVRAGGSGRSLDRSRYRGRRKRINISKGRAGAKEAKVL